MGSKRGYAYRAATLIAVLVVGLVAGCSGAGESSQEASDREVLSSPSVAPSEEAVVQSSPAGEAGAAGDAAQSKDRLIVRTQTVRLEVESTADAVEDIRSLAGKHSAIVTDLQMATDNDEWLYRYDEYGTQTDGSALRGWVTVRVPAESLDAFIESAIALGDVKYQSEGTQDVTQQHVDMAARLENLRAEEARLRSFFDAARNVQDMLAVETELNRIRQEIESLDAQVKYLERQAALATVTIELTQEQAIIAPEGDDWGFRDAITNGFRGAATVLKLAIQFVLTTIPLWVPALLIALAVRLVIKRRKARAGTSAASLPDVPQDSDVG